MSAVFVVDHLDVVGVLHVLPLLRPRVIDVRFLACVEPIQVQIKIKLVPIVEQHLGGEDLVAFGLVTATLCPLSLTLQLFDLGLLT